MWDWYTRPGGMKRIPTWKLGIAIALLACLTTIVLWLFYAAIAPILFTPVGR
jgi:hypothetical protein